MSCERFDVSLNAGVLWALTPAAVASEEENPRKLVILGVSGKRSDEKCPTLHTAHDPDSATLKRVDCTSVSHSDLSVLRLLLRQLDSVPDQNHSEQEYHNSRNPRQIEHIVYTSNVRIQNLR